MLSQPKLIVTQPSLAGAGITIAGNTAIANGVHLNIKKEAPGMYQRSSVTKCRNLVRETI